jgi:LysR family transcriptional regulator, glycine cleavage system transcriptional activator
MTLSRPRISQILDLFRITYTEKYSSDAARIGNRYVVAANMPGPIFPTSLRSLQAFAAVARAGSVVAAADELAVTPSAISHLLRQLEQGLGVTLVRRKGHGLAMTSDGERLAASVGPAFVSIGDALGEFMRRGSELRISLLSSFAMHWLIPRLSRFQSRHPEVELLLSTSTRLIDFSREAFDCAIRLGTGRWPDTAAEQLYREELVAACSPQWLAGSRFRSPRDLERATLIQSKARRQDWVRYFKAAGVAEFTLPKRGPLFETRALAIQAAVARMGVVVIDPRFIEPELAAGQLVMPFDLRVSLDSAYWLVWRPGRETTRPVAAFRRWLGAEILR